MKFISFLFKNLFILTIFCSLAIAQKPSSLVKTKINDAITLKIPNNFTVMPENVYVRKYGAYRKPLAMFTSPNGKIDFGVNETINRSLRAYANADWQEQDMKILKDIFKGSIKGMHTDATFLQDELVTINGKKFIALQFIGTIKDSEEKAISMKSGEIRQYSCIYYTIKEGKILIFNFTCPDFFRNEYQTIAKEIMQSIKINEKKNKSK
jgi:hypothetical protein